MNISEAVKSIKRSQAKKIGKESQCGNCLSNGSSEECEECWCKYCTHENPSKKCGMGCNE